MNKSNLLQSKNVVVLLFFMLSFKFAAFTQTHQLQIIHVDKDTTGFKLPAINTFTDKISCAAYLGTFIYQLKNEGYPTASIDEIVQTDAVTTIHLFLGKKYKWIKLIPAGIDKNALEQSGYREKNFWNKPINMQQLKQLQQRIFTYYENNGYPFAEVFLDSISVDEEKMNALLKVKTGLLYKVDSLRQLGPAKMSKKFLSNYLDIADGSLFNKEKLQRVSKLLLELPYVQETQPGDITLLASGAVLNLYLAPKKSSQVSAIIGFLPSGAQVNKLQVTGDVNLNLKNAFGGGETLFAVWQQLQIKSPRLNLGYQQPYIFNTKFGVDFLFDLFKKDSSFLQIQAQLGLQYILSANQSGKIFLQWQNNFLLANGVDTALVIATKTLPPNIDVNAVNFGIDYQWNKTDYKLNPRSGNEISLTTTVGIKNIKPNNEILSIKDASFNYASLYDTLKKKTYQFKIKLIATHYFPLGKQATFKTSVNTGIYNSPNMFRNELFQIGGYRLLRGFNEESIFATQYVVTTAEYRLRLSLNSNLFGFVDAGWVKNKYQGINLNNRFISGGLGILFETKFGLLNLSYAMGKRDDIPFNIREASKIHFGYINYF